MNLSIADLNAGSNLADLKASGSQSDTSETHRLQPRLQNDACFSATDLEAAGLSLADLNIAGCRHADRQATSLAGRSAGCGLGRAD